MMMDFDLFGLEKKTHDETTIIPSRKEKIQRKIKVASFLKREKVDKVINELPKKGESFHIVSNGTFDYYNIVPRVINLTNSNFDSFFFSTWTISQNNAENIIALFDNNIVKNIYGLVGLYFKNREPEVYNYLFEEMKKRGLTLFANKNHSKVSLLKANDNYFVIEGSANFTSNPRIEQFVFSNSEKLYNFHKSWMCELMDIDEKGKK